MPHPPLTDDEYVSRCWRRHLKVQIEDEGQAAKIPCAGETTLEGGRTGRCSIVLDEGIVERLLKQGWLYLLSQQELFPLWTRFVGLSLTNGYSAMAGKDVGLLKKYSQRLVETYVNNNPTVKWCPFTDCSNAVRVTSAFESSGFNTTVECSGDHQCAHAWCFNCNQEPHMPAGEAPVLYCIPLTHATVGGGDSSIPLIAS